MRVNLGLWAFLPLIALFPSRTFAKVDPSLEPPAEEKDRLSEVVKDVYVVANKYMKKRDRFFLSTYATIDLSDGPYSIYSFHLNPGYIINDFWEVHLNLAPLFQYRERPIVDKIRGLNLASGDKANITMEKAELEVGADILWAPLYGKDSFGMNKVIHSDTFFKFGVSWIKYSSDSGWKIHTAYGKTYFVNQNWGIRPAAAMNFTETIVDKKKSFQVIGNLEVGTVYYF